MSATEETIIAWRDAHSRLRPALASGDQRLQLGVMDDLLTACTELLAENTQEAWAYPKIRDGLNDGDLIYGVYWHGAALGELSLSLGLPDALADGPPWRFIPELPLALEGQVILSVGPDPRPQRRDSCGVEREDNLRTRLQTVVSDQAETQAKVETTEYCIRRLQARCNSGVKAWLAAISDPDEQRTRYEDDCVS